MIDAHAITQTLMVALECSRNVEDIIRAQRAEIERLRRDCSEAYQAVEVMAKELDWWRVPSGHRHFQPIGKLLDNLYAAGNGEPRPHDDLLPFVLGTVAP